MESINKLKEIKLRVESELIKFFDDKINNVENDDSKEALKLLKDFTLRGGKRIRSGMLVYGYACFKDINKDIIKAAMAIELVQSYLLIHDDIIDKDDLRRSKDSMHIMYEKKYDVIDKKHFGLSMAICVGDLAVCLANEILLDTNFNEKARAVKVLNEMIEKVVYGQMLDIIYGKKFPDELSEKDILDVYRLKSASYTIEGPLYIGGILAGIKEDELKPLLDYGVILGKAFQIRDDINGIFGDENKTGKPNDSDLKEGKRTLLVIKALKECSKKERDFILNKLDTDLDENDVNKFREIITKYSLSYCEELSDKFIEEAKSLIKNISLREEGKEFLLEIVDFIAKRDY